MKKVLHDTNLLLSLIKESNKSVIIFDIFDTIIHRKVHPEDIKKIFADRLVKRLQLKGFTYQQMYDLRAQGERELCLQNHNIGNDLEFTFNDLALWMYDRLKGNIDVLLSVTDFICLLRKLELQAEFTNQFVDESLVQVISQLKKEGFTVICCSDFYLDLELIRQVLGQYEVESCFDRIFVSSEFGITKRSGRLYQKILEHYNADDCLMIGDNEESDCNQANRNGIAAIHLDRVWAHSIYTQRKEKFNEDNFRQKLKAIFATDDHFLFEEFALTAFYFIQDLHTQLSLKGYKDVFFLAREGQELKEMFNIYQDTCIKNEELKITPHYLMVSRRATFMPSLQRLENEKFFNLFRQYIKISFAEFMYSLGFDDAEIDPLAAKLGIDKYKREMDFPRSEAFVRTLISDDFYSLYEHRRVAQKNNFKEYLSSFGAKQPDRLAIVDVGWKGTIQDNIFKILDEQVNVEGFYIGLIVPIANDDARNLKHGLLFSHNHRDKFYDIFDENRSLFEVLFAANHGSVISYNKNDNGNIQIKTENFNDEIGFYKNSIFPVIRRITMQFRRISAEYAKTAINTEDLYTLAAKHHSRMVLFPKKEELNWHLDLYHVENFGVFERNVFSKEKHSISFFKMLDNYLEYKKHPDKFTKNTIWPAAEFAKGGLFKSLQKYAKEKYNNVFHS